MPLRVLVDESLPRSVRAVLAAGGFDAVDARDVGLGGTDDRQVFAEAQRTSRFLVSRDVDFADVVTFPLGGHHGIAVVRVPTRRPVAVLVDAVVRALTGLGNDDVRGCLLIINEHRVRIRRPPEP